MSKKTPVKKYKHYNLPTCYEDFVDYCLRKLGAPVVNIEVTPEQIQDRISDMLQVYIEYDLESVCEQWWIHCCTKEDVQNGYLTIPMEVLDVMEVLANGTGSAFQSDGDGKVYSSSLVNFGYMDNPQWQWFNNYWYYGNMFSGGQTMFYYEISMQYIQMLQTLMTAKVEYSYRRRQRKLWFMSRPYHEGEFIALYGTKMLDPETEDSIYSSEWLRAACTANIGIQWGTNLSKFGNVPSAGGLTINGEEIRTRYTEELKELMEEHEQKYREPPMPYFCN